MARASPRIIMIHLTWEVHGDCPARLQARVSPFPKSPPTRMPSAPDALRVVQSALALCFDPARAGPIVVEGWAVKMWFTSRPTPFTGRDRHTWYLLQMEVLLADERDARRLAAVQDFPVPLPASPCH